MTYTYSLEQTTSNKKLLASITPEFIQHKYLEYSRRANGLTVLRLLEEYSDVDTIEWCHIMWDEEKPLITAYDKLTKAIVEDEGRCIQQFGKRFEAVLEEGIINIYVSDIEEIFQKKGSIENGWKVSVSPLAFSTKLPFYFLRP